MRWQTLDSFNLIPLTEHVIEVNDNNAYILRVSSNNQRQTSYLNIILVSY